MKIKSVGLNTVVISFLAFIGLGMSASLLGLAWPSMQKQFGLPLDGVTTYFVLSTMAYSLSSFLIGRLMARFGSGTVLLVGSTLVALSLSGMATANAWGIIVVLAFVSGLGSGTVDAGLNLYTATYHSAQQMNWLHASFGVGVTIGPLIMTFVLQQQLGWQMGYIAVGAIMILVIFWLAITRSLWRTEGFQTAENKPVNRASFRETLRAPVVWFSMITFLAYVGVEIGLGQWTYTLLTQSRGIDPGLAGVLVSVYWGVFTGGRIVFGFIANRFEINRLLRACMLAMIVGAILLRWNPVNAIGLLGLFIIGAAQAPVFPLLMSATANRVGAEHAENAISLQMGGVGIGGAILPGLIGTIGKNLGLEAMTVVFLVMAVVVFIFHELTHLRRVEQPVLTSAGD